MRDLAPWQKRNAKMLIMAVLFGVMVQALFYEKAAGISVVMTVIGFYAIFFFATQGRFGGFERWSGQASIGWFLLLPIMLLAMTYCLYANGLFRFLNGVALPLLIVLQTMLVTRNTIHTWHHNRLFGNVLHAALIRPLANFPILYRMIANRITGYGQTDSRSGLGRLRKVSLGMILAAPILMFVILLLASADQVFQAWVAEIPRWFSGLSIGEWIFRSGLAVFIAWYTFCYLWGLLFPPMLESSDVSNPDSAPSVQSGGGLDPIVAGTLFISVNLVYVVFVLIQFSYLFGATEGLLPSGVYYAEHARRGFAELIIVTLVNLSLLLVGLHVVNRTGALAERIRKLQLSILVGCTVVMLVSAYSRLSLYEEAYGFTLTRLLVHGFMWFLGVLFALTFYRIWRERFSLAKAYLGIAITAYVLINYANLDNRIAVNNIARYERTGVIDLHYLRKLSSDAVPALAKLHGKQPDLPGLEDVLWELRVRADKDGEWPSWNLSKWRAGRGN